MANSKADDPVVIEWPGLPAFRLMVHSRLDRFISEDIRNKKQWEPFETEIVLAFLPPQGTFIDVGANLGWYSVIGALKVGAEGKVFAFEPEPSNFALLQANIALNNLVQVEARQVAASDHIAASRLFLSEDNLGDHRLYMSEEVRTSVDVKVTTLDEQFGLTPPRIDFIKMDTQGSECRIWDGMKRTLVRGGRRHAVPMVVEFWPGGLRRAGSDFARFAQELEKSDLSAFIIHERPKNLMPISWSDLHRWGMDAIELEEQRPEMLYFMNLLLLPASALLPPTLQHFVGVPFSR